LQFIYFLCRSEVLPSVCLSQEQTQEAAKLRAAVQSAQKANQQLQQQMQQLQQGAQKAGTEADAAAAKQQLAEAQQQTQLAQSQVQDLAGRLQQWEVYAQQQQAFVTSLTQEKDQFQQQAVALTARCQALEKQPPVVAAVAPAAGNAEAQQRLEETNRRLEGDNQVRLF
jgi:DNA repair exonuclease SbcCD ATPase subunit